MTPIPTKTITTPPSVSVAQTVAPVSNQPFPAQVRTGQKGRLGVPGDWPEFVFNEVIITTPGVKKLFLPISPLLWRRRVYLYNFANAVGNFTQDASMYLAWDEQKLFKFGIPNTNVAVTTQTQPIFPIAGGNPVQNSIQLIVANQIAAEPMSVIVQPYEIELECNKIILDVNALTGSPTCRFWVGVFSY